MIFANTIIYKSKDILDLPTGGDIGLAVDTVDIGSMFRSIQTTANQLLTLPAPTDVTQNYLVTIFNDGLVDFSLGTASRVVARGSTVTLLWLGSSWVESKGVANVSLLNTSSNETLEKTSGTIKVFVDASGGNRTVTLPSPTNNQGVYEISKVDSSANTVTIIGTILGQANYVIQYQNSYVPLVSNGTEYKIK